MDDQAPARIVTAQQEVERLRLKVLRLKQKNIILEQRNMTQQRELEQQAYRIEQLNDELTAAVCAMSTVGGDNTSQESQVHQLNSQLDQMKTANTALCLQLQEKAQLQHDLDERQAEALRYLAEAHRYETELNELTAKHTALDASTRDQLLQLSTTVKNQLDQIDQLSRDKTGLQQQVASYPEHNKEPKDNISQVQDGRQLQQMHTTCHPAVSTASHPVAPTAVGGACGAVGGARGAVSRGAVTAGRGARVCAHYLQ